MAGALVTAGFLGVFVSGTSAPSAGLLQRITITIPLALLAAVAARLLFLPRSADTRQN